MSGNPETEFSENKSSLSEWREATISLAAFATSQGGAVHIGVSPDNQRMGVQLGRVTLENLANDIRRNTEPPLFPSITFDGDESSAVIHVSIEESPIKPVWAFGKPYKRVGRTNQALTREETLRLVEATTGRTWDALPCSGLRVEHLSREAIEDFLRRSNQDVNTPTETVLENLYLRQPDGTLCNAAALLFTQTPARWIDGVALKCGRFRGDEAIHFLDEHTFEGNLFQQLDGALAFVARNTRQAIKITGRPEHERIPEYPDAAIREAITNAICHRNYTDAAQPQVRIFASGLEVWNPGKLPFDLSIELLYTKHHSHPRNKKIAAAFHRAGLIEQWGTGTVRIVEACLKHGLSRPDFRQEMGGFNVRFESPPIEAVKPVVVSAILTERQRKTLEYVREHGSITPKEYRSLFDLKERQTREDLSEMVAKGHIKTYGKGRSIRYIMPD